MQEGSLYDLVLSLVENLMRNAHFDAVALRGVLDEARGTVGEVASCYDAPAPEGAEAIRELMLESLTLFDSALAQIEAFIDDAEEERLSLAMRDAQEANDLLEAVEDLVQVSKDIISEMVEA